MEISINVSKLNQHLTYLQEELSEVHILLQILDRWELMEADQNSAFFSCQRNQLQKHRNMIHQRISITEALIEEFTKCIHTIDGMLQHSNNVLCSLN